MHFELELERQVLQPGDEIRGWVSVDDAGIDTVDLVFFGEEILGANDVARRYIYYAGSR